MKKNFTKHVVGTFFLLISTLFFIKILMADSGTALVHAIDETGVQGMTLWQVIKAGGFIMIVLSGLSLAALTLIFYNFINLQKSRLVPDEFTEMIILNLEKKQYQSASQLCEENDSMVSRIVAAGLKRQDKGAIVTREAVESVGKREIANLWQNISYLSDIAAVAPMIGLLGTVLGMIQAFNAIAFQTAVVKPILLAGGVGKAMITTAGGLIVAIPVTLFYAYFRGRVQSITYDLENLSSDIVKMLTEK